MQELKAVGINLKSSNNRCLGNITFTPKYWKFYGGTLSLPPIIVDDSTGPKFFNLIAYEMCPDFENDYGVSSYISFLDSLIDESRDVIDLRSAGILRNFLGSDKEVARVFNEIGIDLVPNPDIYKYVKCQIQQYYGQGEDALDNSSHSRPFQQPVDGSGFHCRIICTHSQCLTDRVLYVGLLSSKMRPEVLKICYRFSLVHPMYGYVIPFVYFPFVELPCSFK